MSCVSYAFFDFDNTLARGDSIFSFIMYSLRKRKVTLWHYMKTGCYYFIRNFKPELNAKEVALHFLKGKTESEIHTYCEQYVHDVLKFRFFREGIEEIEKCRKSGMRVVVVSASISMYMDLLKDLLHADEIISTRAIYRDGVFTGRVGVNCAGPEKIVRIKEYLARTGNEINIRSSRGYGDLPKDLFMMQLTGECHLVNPSPAFMRKCPKGIIHRWKEVIGK